MNVVINDGSVSFARWTSSRCIKERSSSSHETERAKRPDILMHIYWSVVCEASAFIYP